MSYYTNYIIKTSNKLLNFHISFEKITKYTIDYNLIDENYYINNISWRDRKNNMKTISKLYSNIVFTIIGEGENGFEDIWIEFYKNGKYYREEIEIQFPTFDENKLKINK